MAWSYVLSLNTNDEKLPNSNFKVSEKLPAGALSDREETIHISSLADKVDTNIAHSLCSWTPVDDVCVETHKESSKGIDVTDCTANQLHIDESQSDEPRDFLYELQQHRKNNPKNLITGSLNINSIRNKFDTIQHMWQCRYIDILALCETKLDDSFPIGQFDVLDYNCVRRDRSSNGGGLMYYIRSDIPHRRRDDLEQAVDSQLGLELIIMELMVNHKEKWLYVLGYKPPDIKKSVFENAFQLLCDVIMNTGGNRTMVAAATIVSMAAADSERISIFPLVCPNKARCVSFSAPDI